MFPHEDTVYVVRELSRHEQLRHAAQQRIAAQATWPNSMPPLADHTTAYLAQQMRRTDEVAEAARVRRLAAAGTGASPGGPVMERIQRTVRTGLGRLGDRRRGTRWGSVGTRSGMPTVLRLIGRRASTAETRTG